MQTEFETATDAEVADLIAAFEAGTDAHNVAVAVANEAYGEHPKFGSDEYVARNAAIEPTQRALAEVNRALSASRNLPVGTYVGFSTKSGWYDTDRSFGVITNVTPVSYVVTKTADYGPAKTARLDRENAHEWQSSHGVSSGGRSLSVVRTPRQQQVHAAQQAARRAQESRQVAERRAYNEAVSAANRAQGAQHQVARDAYHRALDMLVKRHQAEFDALVNVALDVLAADAPGREETTYPEPPSA